MSMVYAHCYRMSARYFILPYRIVPCRSFTPPHPPPIDAFGVSAQCLWHLDFMAPPVTYKCLDPPLAGHPAGSNLQLLLVAACDFSSCFEEKLFIASHHITW